MTNRLYFGDNLEVMREYLRDNPESVDLIYLDPPFNSKAEYNVVFESAGDEGGTAQAGAFLDSWSWNAESETCYEEVMRHGGAIANMLQSLRTALGPSQLMAYLTMMTPRLIELKRLLKPTGSIWLHCDPTASHYLKILLDQIFGAENFRNEVIWQRSTGKSLTSRRLPTNHDVILCYGGGGDTIWNGDAAFIPYDENNLPQKTAEKYCHVDERGRRYTLGDLTNPNKNRPNLTYEFLGVKKVWRWTRDRMERAYEDGLVHQSAPGRVPRLKKYLDELRGLPLGDVWTDIAPLNSQSRERMGYPTQKPRELLDRIISLASNEGDVVLDPFCGCGTTIEAAQEMKRGWIGIDVAVHAVKVIESRLDERIDETVDYSLEGIPRDFASAERLAARDKYQFEWWANYLFNPFSVREKKKGGDRGIDGEIFFPNGPGRPYGKILTSVKGGDKLNPGMIRDFKGVLDREKAEMGLFICLRQPTAGMKSEAAQAGFADIVHGRMPRLQIVSIEDYFEGRMPQLPPLPLPSTSSSPARRRQAAAKVSKPSSQGELLFTFTDEQLDPAYIPKPAKGEERHVNPVFKAG